MWHRIRFMIVRKPYLTFFKYVFHNSASENSEHILSRILKEKNKKKNYFSKQSSNAT